MTNFLIISFALIFLLSTVASINVKPIHPKDISSDNNLRVNRRPSLSGRIVNGQFAAINQFPFQVSIKGFRGSTVSVCGGSLISNEYVLTAAHCTRGYEYLEVGAGSNFLKLSPIKLTAEEIIEHPDFDDEYLINDIAIIKLPMKIPFNHQIKPIALPSLSQAKLNFVNYKASVSGFGRTFDGSQVSNQLRYVDVRVISRIECQMTYGSIITDKVICAKGWISNRNNACQGDSGGPVSMKVNGTEVLVGVVSFVSIRGCEYGDPSGFTRVSSYLKWISDKTDIPLKQ
jgi:secreted trypsin-like serine protease